MLSMRYGLTYKEDNMELDKKLFEKVIDLKGSFDIITDERMVCVGPLYYKKAKLAINIISFKNADNDHLIMADITIHESDYGKDEEKTNLTLRLYVNTGVFLFNLPYRSLGLEKDKDAVLYKMNRLTYQEFEDVNKAVIDLMYSYIK